MTILRPLQIMALLGALFSVSCSATYTASGRVTKKGSVQITHNAEDSGDAGVKAAIKTELIKRGFTLTESAQSDLIARFSDTWRWDVLMYLSNLEISLTDRRTNQELATGRYRNAAVHTYPSVKNVVPLIFAKLDEESAFGR
jgi:hypothetical protein